MALSRRDIRTLAIAKVRLEDLGCCRVLISRKQIVGPCCMEDADGLQQTTSPQTVMRS
jgi:hypothetical protein